MMKMRDANRIPRIMAKLQQAWEKYPDMRLTQLLINMGLAADSTAWFVEDDLTELQIEKILREGL
jgi:uncharacterized protein YihD (DUF1040 family)